MVRPLTLRPPSSRSQQIFSGAWGVAVCFVIAFLLLDTSWVIWYSQRAVALPPVVAPLNAGVAFPRELTAKIDACPTIPVIGLGVMLQVVTVDAKYAYDPFTNVRLRPLTALERHATKGCPGAINRFIEMPPNTVALTYDDGPTAAYTPQLLKILRKNGVRATFFGVGDNAAKNPTVLEEEATSQVVGNHTMTHPEINKLSDDQARRELVLSSRVFTATGHLQPRLFRPPYLGNDVDSLRTDVRAILTAQQLGMTTVGFTDDTSDFEYGYPGAVVPVPVLDGSGQMILMHDGGGNRQATLALTTSLIRQARDRKVPLHFITADELLPHNQAVTVQQPTWADNLAYFVLHTQGDPLRLLINKFFLWSTIIIGSTTLGLILMAVGGSMLRRRQNHSNYLTEERGVDLPRTVSVLMPAWNEEKGIERAIRRIFAFSYQFDLEVVVVDDGSTDDTPNILARLQGEFSEYPKKLVVLRGEKGGKARALNRAILSGELHSAVTVMIDGDTIVDGNTIPYLVRHFGCNPNLGAVAGRVGVLRIGRNPWQKFLVRWQLAKYNMDIGVTRLAQDVMDAILIVPGACCAYRTNLLVEMSGFGTETMAEDAERGMMARWYGWDVMMDLEAVAYTETPITFKALCRQQFRWAFGIYQVIYLHRRMMAHPITFGPLAWFVMPYTMVSTIMPFVFMPVNLLVTGLAITTHNWGQLWYYIGFFVTIQVMLSVAGMISLREWSWDPVMAVFFRLVNDPIQVYVACRSMKAILLGRSVSWGHVPRVGDTIPVATTVTGSPELAEA